MTLGARLKQIRMEQGKTQKALSEILGVSRSTYAHYEMNSREPDIETLKEFARYFDVSLDYLTGKSEFRSSAEWLLNFIKRQQEANPELKVSDLDLPSEE
ncbi:MAG: hypothetical protein PWP10_2672 [Clostridiales bacterium]|nr:hypothetical protein [Clostridiales bacterium]